MQQFGYNWPSVLKNSLVKLGRVFQKLDHVFELQHGPRCPNWPRQLFGTIMVPFNITSTLPQNGGLKI